MSGSGVIFKRCGCQDPFTGRRFERRCPRLVERGHGAWTFHASAANLLGRSERVRRGGFASQAAARRARDEWLARTGEERTAQSWTMEQWLRYWLSTRTTIRPTTRLHYTRDVDNVLIPHLGRYRLLSWTCGGYRRSSPRSPPPPAPGAVRSRPRRWRTCAPRCGRR